MKLQTKIMALFSILLVFVIAVLSFIYYDMLSDTFIEEKGKQALDIAKTVAGMPSVQRAFYTEDPAATIQPIAERVREMTNAEFVVVGNTESIRYSHPVEERIGRKMVGGDNDRALLKGESYISHAKGSLGYSVRGKTPVFGKNDEIIGVVSVGILEKSTAVSVGNFQNRILFLVTLAIAIGAIGSYLIARNVKRSIFGLEPEEIAEELLQKKAIIESVREGIIAVNDQAEITAMNQQAIDMLKLNPKTSYLSMPIAELLSNTKMPEILTSKEIHLDDEIALNGQEVIANRQPILDDGQVKGVVASFRRKDELDRMAKELARVHQYTDVLRAQTHEYANKLNTIAGLIQLNKNEEALELIQKEQSSYEELIQFLLSAIPHPLVAGIMLGKYNRAQELKISLMIVEDSTLYELPSGLEEEELVTIIGNLLDNAFTAVLPLEERKVQLFVTDIGHDVIIEVEDNGPGVSSEEAEEVFSKGVTTKQEQGHGYGLYLIQQLVHKAGGYVTVTTGELGGALFTVYLPKEREGE
ncbi:ATP-binding protein [Bacillus thermotolerans]|uniref:ATP-binding protein n=1 Tax=Bacillus thermotolerans TaxID=1221996 RepID=UPI0005837E06|nr:sensor histidine kinase [Bacillus thermotolerans]KKB36168.1 Sensor kinase CitA, DpiB [Bacillus thermotolerans]